MPWKVTNATRNHPLADRAERAARFDQRLIGWMGRRRIEPGEGLHLLPCQGIHTFFMRVAIDVVFLDEENRVVIALDRMPPWRVAPGTPRARSVLELPAGALQASGTSVGDLVTFEPACAKALSSS